MKRFLILAVLCGVVGCGQATKPGVAVATPVTPGFTDEGEELRYLQALASPTIEQFRRREALAKADAKRREDREAEELIRASLARAEQERREKARDILKAAKASEKAGSLGLARNSYQILVEDYASLPEAKEAAEGLARVTP